MVLWTGCVALAAGVSGCAGADGGYSDEEATAQVELAQKKKPRKRNKLEADIVDSAGNAIGSYTFKDADGRRNTPGILVTARVSGLTPGFHGTHLHANNDPANGEGCVAPAFTSTDGHLNPEGNVHGDHAGDLPVLMIGEDGTGFLSFITDRVTLDEIDGTAVIIHALPDNFHNIPVGPNADQYTPNSDAATALTDGTGNAGARVGCGVIE
jgi:Cu-Zn family superoxide dismutase